MAYSLLLRELFFYLRLPFTIEQLYFRYFEWKYQLTLNLYQLNCFAHKQTEHLHVINAKCWFCTVSHTQTRWTFYLYKNYQWTTNTFIRVLRTIGVTHGKTQSKNARLLTTKYIRYEPQTSQLCLVRLKHKIKTYQSLVTLSGFLFVILITTSKHYNFWYTLPTKKN